MIDRSDLLTWQGLRSLATCEAVVTAPGQVCLATPDPDRPVLKRPSDLRWLQTLRPMQPPAGAIVYARTSWRLPNRQALRAALTEPAVLVSTFYDPPIKDTAAHDLLDDDSPIAHWFGVQMAAQHPRLTALPLGVEPEMVPILQAAERRETRDILLYLNFQCAHRYEPLDGMRAWLYHAFGRRPWVVADPWRADAAAHYAQQLGRAKFVLSPRGFGFDCYRTYEALIMGAIPIVKRHPPQTEVCAGMGVLFVDSWREVTEARLKTEWERRAALGAEPARLTMAYWADRIQRTAAAAARAPLRASA